jgi:uncharacterized protein YuzE
MNVEYDSEVDSLYVELVPLPVQETDELESGVCVDYAEDGTVVGVEFIAVGESIDLSGVPEAERVRAAIDAYNAHASRFIRIRTTA